jgi:alkylation response protein AidB-like acyl-CoA dehydrogenase
MKIPVENLLGERNNGFKIALNALNVGRIKLAAACLDAQRRILNHSIQYSNERKQFGVSISTFGAIRKKLAEMATGVFVSEAGSYRAAKNIQDKIEELVAGGMDHQAAELKGVEEFAVECSILKVFVSDLLSILQMKEFRFTEEWDSLKILRWKQHGEIQEFQEFMKEPTKSTDY